MWEALRGRLSVSKNHFVNMFAIHNFQYAALAASCPPAAFGLQSPSSHPFAAFSRAASFCPFRMQYSTRNKVTAPPRPTVAREMVIVVPSSASPFANQCMVGEEDGATLGGVAATTERTAKVRRRDMDMRRCQNAIVV